MGDIKGKPEVNKIVGMSVNEAKSHLDTLGYSMRVLNEDGKAYMATTEFKPNRVNVSVSSGVINEVEGIG